MKMLLPLLTFASFALWPAPIAAQQHAAIEGYPTRPVKVIVPRPPGNANDLIARVLVQKLSEETSGQFYVENLPAGGGIVEWEPPPARRRTAIRSWPRTRISSSIRWLKRKGPYDPFKSFAPVSLLASAPEVIVVHPSVPAKDMKELIALLKGNPGKYNYASPGHGTSPHIACERLFKMTNELNVVHVPFPGGGQAVQSTVAGHTAILHITLPLIAPLIKEGKLRALAIASDKRSPQFPDVPTLNEAGIAKHEVGYWTGIMVPAATPDRIVGLLNQAVGIVLSSSDVKERLAKIGFEPMPGTARVLRTTSVRRRPNGAE